MLSKKLLLGLTRPYRHALYISAIGQSERARAEWASSDFAYTVKIKQLDTDYAQQVFTSEIPLQYLIYVLLAQTESIQKVIEFLNTTKRISVKNILEYVQELHSDYNMIYINQELNSHKQSHVSTRVTVLLFL
jgi:hypothetical protein